MTCFVARAASVAASLALIPASAALAAPPSYVGVSYGSSNVAAGPVTIKPPAGTQDGDLMLAYVATQSTKGEWLTAPAGWTPAIKTFNSVQSAQLYWRVARDEPASYSWSGASYPKAIIRTYRGVDAKTPVGGSVGCGANAAACQLPAFSEAMVEGERYVAFWDFNTASARIAPPSDLGNVSIDFTQRATATGDKALSGSGAKTVAAATATVSVGAAFFDGIGVTIRPASTSTPVATPEPPPAAPAAGSGVKAASATDFLNSLGVGGGVLDMDVAPLVNYIGVRNLRGGSFEGGYTAASAINIARATGTKITWGLSAGWARDLSKEIAASRQLADAGVLLAVEGANEPDTWPVTYQGATGGGSGSWIAAAKLQRDLYAAVKADPVLKNYPVFQTTHGGAEIDNVGLQYLTIPNGAKTAMPDGTKYADYANMHNYVIWAGAKTPVANAAWNSASPYDWVPPTQYILPDDYGTTWKRKYSGYAKEQLATLPRVTTETGWWVDSGGEENQGKTLLNVYLAQFKRGYKYTFLYAIKDRWSERFGIFKADNSPRLAAHYIHNLTTILADDAAVSATPGSLPYAIAGQPGTVHDLLLQKSDGRFELVVWDERPVGQGGDDVTVDLGATRKTVRVYDVVSGVSPKQTLTNVRTVPLGLTDHPMILEIED
ncbi:hypothetical protein [Methylocella sp.]|uniref:hypothetical protein n=1 Tax=Methylocella sp. TaxID=1978226 RepID=UPI003784FA0E